VIASDGTVVAAVVGEGGIVAGISVAGTGARVAAGRVEPDVVGILHAVKTNDNTNRTNSGVIYFISDLPAWTLIFFWRRLIVYRLSSHNGAAVFLIERSRRGSGTIIVASELLNSIRLEGTYG
jgi:hypothetical protein